jgi:hypothetical protein
MMAGVTLGDVFFILLVCLVVYGITYLVKRGRESGTMSLHQPREKRSNDD